MNQNKDNQAKDTGLAITLIFLLVIFFTEKDQLLIAAICTLVMCMTWPTFFKPVAPLWFGFSHFLGNIVSKILLSAMFILLVSPVGLVRRILGFDSMKIKQWRDGSKSVFVDREHIYKPKDLETPY